MTYTIYYTDGELYTGDDAMDALWWDLGDDSVEAISADLRAAALDHIAQCEGEAPMSLTPDSAAAIIDGIPVR